MTKLIRYENLPPDAGGTCCLIDSPLSVTDDLRQYPPDVLWLNSIMRNQKAVHHIQGTCFLGTGNIGNKVCRQLSKLYAAPMKSVYLAGGGKSVANRRLIDSHLKGKDIIIVTGSIDDNVFWQARGLALSYAPLVWIIGVLPDEHHSEPVSLNIEHNETFCIIKDRMDQLLRGIHSIQYTCSAQSLWRDGLSAMQLLFASKEVLSISMSSGKQNLKSSLITCLAHNETKIRHADRIQANLFIRRGTVSFEDVFYLQKHIGEITRPDAVESLLIQWRPDLESDFQLTMIMVQGDDQDRHIPTALIKKYIR